MVKVEVVDRGGLREVVVNGYPIARVFTVGGSRFLSIDVVAPWNFEETGRLCIDARRCLIYGVARVGDLQVELVGYDNGEVREVISARVKLGDGSDEAAVALEVLRHVAPHYLDSIAGSGDCGGGSEAE